MNFTWMHAFQIVFQRYDPNFAAASLDEAYLNITNVCEERHIASEEVSRNKLDITIYLCLGVSFMTLLQYLFVMHMDDVISLNPSFCFLSSGC